MNCLWDQLERAARRRRNAPAIAYAGSTLDWVGARDMAAGLSVGLSTQGVREGRRVAFLSPNSLEFLLMPFAVERAGGVFVPLNWRLTEDELVEQLEDCSPTVLICAEPHLELARVAGGRVGIPIITVSELQATGRPVPPQPARGPNEPVAIYYTGGTTGRAKGVILTADRLVLNALQWAHALGASEDEHLLVVAPMFHMVAALNAMIAAVLACDLTILDRFTPEATLDAIEQGGVNNLAVVPAMIDMLLAHDGFVGRDVSRLRTLTYGGSPITQRTLKGALSGFPSARMFQVYGQTEGGPTISVLGPEWHSTDPACEVRLRSAGKPLVLTDVRIARPDGSECAPGETGEIAVRGPAVSPGYWNRQEETAEAHRDGWLHTGDAGYFDTDGFLFIVDRIKDMIVSGGENVYAAEVERIIARHPGVAECAVIGVPSERWGESVHAIVRPTDGSSTEDGDILGFCRQHLAGFKVPRSFAFRIDPFPLTAANKIDKRALRSWFFERQEA